MSTKCKAANALKICTVSWYIIKDGNLNGNEFMVVIFHYREFKMKHLESVKASVVVKWDPDLMSILREKCVIETCWTCTKPVLEQMGLLSEILMCLYWEKNVSLNILKVYKTKIRAVGVAKWDPDVAILRLYCLLAAN